MADRTIGDLPAASQLLTADLIPIEQGGNAKSISGQIFAEYAREKAQQAAGGYAANAAQSAAEAEAAAALAEAWSAHPPYIDDTTGDWFVYNTQTQQFVNSGVHAQGPQGATGTDGVSPEVNITSIAGGHRVTITDSDHPSGQSFDVLDGAGSGDMTAATYDPQSAVANAGGIPDYVESQVPTAAEKAAWDAKMDAAGNAGTTGQVLTKTATGHEWRAASGGFKPQIVATAPTGSTVTISKGGTTITGTEQSGVWYIDVPEYGTWTVTATKSGSTSVDTVNVTEVKQYEVEVFYVSGTLESNSWADISKIARKGTGANYWSVGDTKTVALSGTVGTLDVTGSYDVFIIGFNHNGVTGITFQGFKASGTDVCLCDSYYNQYSKYDGTKYFQHNHWGPSIYGKNYGGWKGSEMRYDILGSTNNPPTGYGSENSNIGRTGYDAAPTTPTSPVANTLMAALPSALRSVMQPMTVYTDNVGNSSNVADHVTASVDYLPLLAEFEIFNARTNANQYEQNYQAQYDYYKNGNSKIKYKHVETSTAAIWWERSPNATNDSYFCDVTNSGAAGNDAASRSRGLAPVFML